MSRNAIIHQDVTKLQQLMTILDKKWLQDPAPIHTFYRSHFNLIDLIDRYWYRVADHQQNHCWKSKMILAIL